MKASVVFVINNFGQILVLKRSSDDRWQPGKWGLPGGKLDKGETHEAAAIRDVKEESGLSIFEPKLVHSLAGVESEMDIRYYVTRNFFGTIKVDPAEHSDHKWILPKDIIPSECTPNLRMLALKHAS